MYLFINKGDEPDQNRDFGRKITEAEANRIKDNFKGEVIDRTNGNGRTVRITGSSEFITYTKSDIFHYSARRKFYVR